MTAASEISLSIKNEALRLGFSACGFAKVEALPEDAKILSEWLKKSHHAGMQYMENYFEKRTNPGLLVPGSKSVISLLLNYYSNKKQKDLDAPLISKYAYGVDYHFVMKAKMKSLYAFINENFGPIDGRVFVDSAPVLDRVWAKKAGLGWIGKHSNLINRELGSFVFIGELIIDLELDYNKIPESDFCGDCTICIDACPTEAILDNRTLDSKKCISYLTIENRKEIPEEFKGRMENRAFGCDICQDVCPWNRKAIQNTIDLFVPKKRLLEMKKPEWSTLSKEDFNKLFKNSAVKRAGYSGLQRNINFISSDKK
jgi:epoxyqueuosine reductase